MKMMQPRRLIGEAMIEERLITRPQLEEGLKYQAKVKKLIGETLIELGHLKEGTLLNFLAGFFYNHKTRMITNEIRILEDIRELITDDFKKWLIFMVERNASDLHLIAGVPPRLRIHGELVSTKITPLSAEKIKELIYNILTYQEIEVFEQTKALDKSFEIENVSRYRINLHWQRDSIGVSVRALPLKVPGFDELGIPEILKDFALRRNGLVLITGPAGCGKSTTLASVLEYINITQAVNIITIEDPIEYVLSPKNSLIRQREIGTDTLSYQEALKSVVRQDPNIIFLGEMRDLDTIQAALTLAETGHLILSTLHTQDASHSITRMVDVFPLTHQHEVRMKLSLVLQGVIVQQLIPRQDKKGRVLACEILNCTNPIRNLIRENNLAQIRSFIQIGGQSGMKSMNQSLVELVKAGVISLDEARLRSNDKDEFEKYQNILTD